MHFVVTGGSSGVGAALVARLTNAGHTVTNLDVQKPSIDIPGSQFVPINLADADVVRSTIDQIPQAADGLANVAGIARADDPVKVIAVNFLGARLITELLTERIRASGSVVNVSSVAGSDWQARFDRIAPLLATESFEEGLSWCQAHTEVLARDPYTFSKRCLSGWSALRAESLKTTGVRTNCISPGGIDTRLHPQFKDLMGAAHAQWEVEQVGRLASPDDIAQVLDMLLTSEANWLNGADVPVDGGYAAGRASGWIDFNESPAMQAIRAKQG
ncbi:MAG: SDR family oxidoreductase [Pseudomonadota bacterium]